MIGVQTMSCRFGSRSSPLTCCLEGMQLLVRGFCTAVPRLRKVRHRRAEVQVVEGRSDPAERLVSHRPDSLEYPAARKSLFLGARDERLNLLLQRIDAGVLVSQAVAQNVYITLLETVEERW